MTFVPSFFQRVRPGPSDPTARVGGTRVLAVFTAALLLMMWSATAYWVLRDRADTLRAAETEVQNRAAAHAAHLAKTLEAADQTLRFLRAEAVRLGEALNIKAYLEGKDIIQSDFHQLGIIGPTVSSRTPRSSSSGWICARGSISACMWMPPKIGSS